MNAHHDYLIIGAGPAGLQLGYFLNQNQRDYLILERAEGPGTFFKDFPRHRFLLSINKLYTGTDHPVANLRWDWNSLLSEDETLRFTRYSKRYFPDAGDLYRYLVDFAQRFDFQVQYNTRITQVSKQNGLFTLEDDQGNTYTGKRLVVATGLFTPYVPDIPGIELCDTYGTHSLDPEDYTNQRVLVIGKGNSAFETANHLIETAAAIHLCSPESVRLAWQTHFVGNLRAVNNDFLDTYQLKSQNTVIDATVQKIEQPDGHYLVHLAYSHARGQTAAIAYDKVILCTGFRFDASIFDESCQPELAIHGKFPAQTTEWESTNVKDLYFAGTLMQACDYKKTMSAFIHGFRHNIQALSKVFEGKYHGTPWPSQTLEATPEAVLDKTIERLTTAPGMFLQPGFLCDVLVVSEEERTARYYDDLRLDYIAGSSFSQADHYYTISLEYGHFGGDPFSIERDPNPEQGAEAPYLHPVIRRYRQGELVAEHHIQDDLENAWYKEVYARPARAFFEAQLTPRQAAAPALNP